MDYVTPRCATSEAVDPAGAPRRRKPRDTADGSFAALVERLERAAQRDSADPERALLLRVLRIVELDTRESGWNAPLLRARVKREMSKALARLY
jgi:hypothetical protein